MESRCLYTVGITCFCYVPHSQESQGFTASTSRTRLIYEFEKERKEPVEKDQSPFPRTVQSSPSKVASTPRLQAAAEENAGQPSPYRTRQVSPSKVSASALRSYASPAVSDNGPAVSVLSRAALFDTPRQVPKDPTELVTTDFQCNFMKILQGSNRLIKWMQKSRESCETNGQS